MWNLKNIFKKLVNITKKKQTHRYREQWSPVGRGKQGGAIQGYGIKRYKLLGIK